MAVCFLLFSTSVSLKLENMQVIGAVFSESWNILCWKGSAGIVESGSWL